MKLTDSAIILAGITAYLYCSSTAYTYGYLQYFELNAEVLDRNFHQTLYDGLIRNIAVLFLAPFALLFTLLLPIRKLLEKFEIKAELKALSGSLLFVIAMLVIEGHGIQKAEEVDGAMSKKTQGKAKIVFNENELSVYLLYCGSRNCVGREIDSKEIIYFPQSSGFLYTQS